MTEENIKTLPLLALRGLVCIPGTTLHFEVARKKSVAAVTEAMKGDQLIFVVCQKELATEEVDPQTLYSVGTVAKIKQMLKVSDGVIKILIEGVHRAQLLTTEPKKSYLEATVSHVHEFEIVSDNVNEALVRNAQEAFDDYCSFIGQIPPEISMEVMSAGSALKLSDFITANIPLKYELKQQILEQNQAARRMELLIGILYNEIEILDVQQKIHLKVQDQMQKSQRDFYLREQIKAIENELGEGESPRDEAREFKNKIMALGLDKKSQDKLLSEASRLEKAPQGSPDGAVIRTYLEYCLSLPFNKSSKEQLNITCARKILNADHYGLAKVKERILEYLAVKKMSSSMSGQILCLVGPPGVGKTSVAASIARAMNRKYVRASLGGVRDEAEIRGHRKTYIGSMPGRIISSIIQAGVKNPLILLDEIDKLGSDYKGDPSSALLEVLDSEQNKSFRDHYIEIPFDLSDVMFITTANTTDTIPRPLLDRMDVIELGTYTDEEKYHIAVKHLIPKQLKKHGLTKSQVKFAPVAVQSIISFYTKESGVRSLERRIADICRKVAMKIIEDGAAGKITVGADLTEYLGPEKFKDDLLCHEDRVGIVNGLAYTSVGGEMLTVEVAVMDGTGKYELTGSLGDVMKESCKAAISYIRSVADSLGIQPDFYKTKDIHIHVPDGATPKDGPSAGITIATAIISELTGIPVKFSVAMTGEITLRGRVLPIGGLREKTMAAYKNGIETILIPQNNLPDLAEIEQVVKERCKILPVKNMEDVLKIALKRYPCKQPAVQPFLTQSHGESAILAQ